MSSKKISQLPSWAGENNPIGQIPISVNGTTYYITPQQLISSLQEITDANNETTNPINFNGDIEIGCESPLGIFYFKLISSGYKQFLLNVDNTDDRIARFPDFDVKVNGCVPIDNYTNDVTAAAGGIAIGQMYHTAGVVKIRIT